MFSVWFECKTCRGSFLEVSHFLEHKKRDHFDEFQNTECIIFEERRIQNYETLTLSFSPTPQEIRETNSHEFIDLQTIKNKNENLDECTNPEFQSHTEDQTLNFLEPDYTISSDQNFENEADKFISSKNGASATHFVNISSISQNPTATNGTCLDKDSCEYAKTILDLENKADSANNVNADAFHSSNLEPTQLFVETQRNPFVNLKRLTDQEIQRRSGKDSNTASSVKYTEKADSIHSIGKCSDQNVNMFECKLCLDNFITDLELTAHSSSCILSRPNRKNFCAPCNKMFSTIDKLNKHVIRNHPAEIKTVKSKKLKKCHLCSRKFMYESDLKRHSLTHSRKNKRQKISSRPFASQRCGASTNNKYKLPKHSTTDAAEKTINKQSIHKTYPKISKTKNNDNDILRLTTSVGISGSEKSSCDQPHCGKTFPSKYDFKRHMATHSDARPFKCPTPNCKKTFKRKDHVREHTINVHSDLGPGKHSQVNLKKRITKNVICPEVGCKKMFKSKPGLREHLLIHQYLNPLKCSEIETDDQTHANSQSTQPAVKIYYGPFKCKHPKCGKLFPLKCRLKRHEATHSDARPLKCTEPSCLKAFKEKNYLLMHVRMHAKSKLGRKNDFKTHNQTTKHAISKSRTKDQDALSTDLTSFKCNKLHCGKQFRNKFNLKRHFVTAHLGKRPFKCPVSTCDYRCTQKNHLKTHLLAKKHKHVQDLLTD